MFRIKKINFSYYGASDLLKFSHFSSLLISSSVEHFFGVKVLNFNPMLREVSEMFLGLEIHQIVPVPTPLLTRVGKLSHQQRSFRLVTSDFHHFHCHSAEFIIFKCREQRKFSSDERKNFSNLKIRNIVEEIDDKIDMREYLERKCWVGGNFLVVKGIASFRFLGGVLKALIRKFLSWLTWRAKIF